MHTKRIIKNVLLGLLLLTYPFIVYFGLFYFEPNILAIVVAVLLLLRHFSQPLNAKNQRGKIPHLNSLLLNSVLFAENKIQTIDFKRIKMWP